MPQPATTYKANLPVLLSVTKSSRARLALLCLLISVLLPIYAKAQSDPDDVVRVSTDLLLFPVRVRDKDGRPVAGLTERDLSLKDKDRATSALHFSLGAERVALVFALDQSGSLRQIISQQRDAALALFEHFGQRSRVAVIRFAESPVVVAPFGRDTRTVREAFDFSSSNLHTAIFDAAAAAVKALNESQGDRAERRIVILISDGLDNASTTKASKVIDDANAKHVSFYVIHLPLFEPREGHLAVRQPTKGFRDLAEKTGGRYFLAGNADSALTVSKNIDLTPVFNAIEDDLRSQYMLGFYIAESARDGRRHEFSVSLIPRGVEYSVGRFGYSRTHDFFVNLPPTDRKFPH